MIKYYCDRCGKDMTGEHERNVTAELPKMRYYPNCKLGYESTIEVCRECGKKYIEWLEGDKEE